MNIYSKCLLSIAVIGVWIFLSIFLCTLAMELEVFCENVRITEGKYFKYYVSMTILYLCAILSFPFIIALCIFWWMHDTLRRGLCGKPKGGSSCFKKSNQVSDTQSESVSDIQTGEES